LNCARVKEGSAPGQFEPHFGLGHQWLTDASVLTVSPSTSVTFERLQVRGPGARSDTWPRGLGRPRRRSGQEPPRSLGTHPTRNS
jgi:hypothetical protein